MDYTINKGTDNERIVPEEELLNGDFWFCNECQFVAEFSVFEGDSECPSCKTRAQGSIRNLTCKEISLVAIPGAVEVSDELIRNLCEIGLEESVEITTRQINLVHREFKKRPDMGIATRILEITLEKAMKDGKQVIRVPVNELWNAVLAGSRGQALMETALSNAARAKSLPRGAQEHYVARCLQTEGITSVLS